MVLVASSALAGARGGLSFDAVSGGDDGMHLHEKNLQEKMSVWTERRTQQEACVAQARA